MVQNYSVSIILPAINETYSLQKTIDIILEHNRNYIKEIIIILSKNKTSKKTITVANKCMNLNPKYINIEYQTLPFLGGAIRKGFEIATGTHVVMMASDLETDPNDVQKFLKISIKNKNSIITASRWVKGGSFKKYSSIKLILNLVFQNIMKLLFGTNLTDLTYGYRLFPNEILKKIKWDELKHPFLLETILKPLKMKVNIIEIPSKWEARSEGISQNAFITNFYYIKTAMIIKFFWKNND